MDVLAGASSGDADAQHGCRSGEADRRGSRTHPLPWRIWLPLAVLVEGGAFPRFQSVRTELRQATEPGSVYYFVSHRWLASSEPDPEGSQARFLAWQLFAAVCEAVEIVRDRGLSATRQASPLFNVPVGRFGSRLEESLVVGLLQPGLDDTQVQKAADEVAAGDSDLVDRGSSMADRDTGLRQLRERLVKMPVVRGLLDKVFIWYDYSCLPQAPRSEEDEPFFRAGLAHLNQCSSSGRRPSCSTKSTNTSGVRGACSRRSLPTAWRR